MISEKVGYLLVNLGTPESPHAEDVRIYLDQFLMDPDVIDIPYWIRWGLVKLVILKDRPHQSSLQYQTIWTEQGSPLFFHTQNLTEGVKRHFQGKAEVEMAMRYGRPSIDRGIEALLSKHVTRLVVLPLYPQYSLAATGSSVTAVRSVMRRMRKQIPVESIQAFYHQEAYLNAVVQVSEKYLPQDYDMALFSFHGIPERQVKKTDKTGRHCLKVKDCSLSVVEANVDCYRAQCYATARRLAEKMGIPETKYRVGFQSRLGRTPWIQPYSDEWYRQLPKQGFKKLVVFCPSFVADCLETLEEVSVRGEEEFIQHGGEKITLIPSLNSESEWISAVSELLVSAPREKIC